MLNDVKYKSSLTLTLETPKLKSQHSIREFFDDDMVCSSLCELKRSNHETTPSIAINSNQLPNMRRSRTYNQNETFHELSSPSASSCSNETIIPIKCLMHEERTNCNQIDIEKFAEISPKYCCTLEVKFVW